MKTIQIQSKNEKEYITVSVHKNKVVVDQRGFAPVKDHHMHMTSINVDFIKRYYTLPEGVSV